MPELPEVEAWRHRLQGRGLDRTIREVELRDEEKLRESLTPGEADSLLRGRRFVEARRHGKHLFAGVDEGGWLRLHFGMSGDLRFLEGEEAWPEHACLRLTFRDGGWMAYVNVRKLGQIGHVDTVEDFVARKGMGPDPVADEMEVDEFRRALEGRRGMIKSALMNQEILAGLGNEMGDEILLDAAVHPRSAVNELEPDVVGRLYRSMMAVLGAAVEACRSVPEGDSGAGRWPDQFLMPDREEGAACPRCGGTVERTEVSGRSTYFCPDHQA